MRFFAWPPLLVRSLAGSLQYETNIEYWIETSRQSLSICFNMLAIQIHIYKYLVSFASSLKFELRNQNKPRANSVGHVESEKQRDNNRAVAANSQQQAASKLASGYNIKLVLSLSSKHLARRRKRQQQQQWISDECLLLKLPSLSELFFVRIRHHRLPGRLKLSLFEWNRSSEGRNLRKQYPSNWILDSTYFDSVVFCRVDFSSNHQQAT